MTPLHAILNWWESLDDFPREHLAAEVCLRLIPNTDAHQAESLFRSFLTEQLPGNWHLGRVLAIRAVIDFWFMCDRQSASVTAHFDNVEGADVRLKSLSNAALGRVPRVRKAVDTAFDTWQRLREAAISDTSLISAERAAMLRRGLG